MGPKKRKCPDDDVGSEDRHNAAIVQRWPVELECVVCFAQPHQIMNFCARHVICSSCHSQLRTPNCPMCQRPTNPVAERNELLEALTRELLFACPHRSDGCTTVATMQDMRTHILMHDNFPRCPYCNGSPPCGGTADGITREMLVNNAHGHALRVVDQLGGPKVLGVIEVASDGIQVEVPEEDSQSWVQTGQKWYYACVFFVPQDGHPDGVPCLFLLQKASRWLEKEDDKTLFLKVYSFMPVKDLSYRVSYSNMHNWSSERRELLLLTADAMSSGADMTVAWGIQGHYLTLAIAVTRR